MTFKRGFILLLTVLFVMTATSVVSAQMSRIKFINGSELSHLSIAEMNTYDQVIVVTTASQISGALFALGAGTGSIMQTRHNEVTHVFMFRQISPGVWMRVYCGTVEDTVGQKSGEGVLSLLVAALGECLSK